MKINLLVIRTVDPLALKLQYEKLGFNFEHHQHGNGPFHYAAEQDGFVFEIYPLNTEKKSIDQPIRLGFELVNLTETINSLEDSNWKIITKPKLTEWGLTAVIEDLDGRKIELRSRVLE